MSRSGCCPAHSHACSAGGGANGSRSPAASVNRASDLPWLRPALWPNTPDTDLPGDMRQESDNSTPISLWGIVCSNCSCSLSGQSQYPGLVLYDQDGFVHLTVCSILRHSSGRARAYSMPKRSQRAMASSSLKTCRLGINLAAVAM